MDLFVWNRICRAEDKAECLRDLASEVRASAVNYTHRAEYLSMVQVAGGLERAARFLQRRAAERCQAEGQEDP